ncbi:MAG: FKBP-type peptidyl-prolyl cis-trans isomerase [Chitinophagales bacterium]|nr:FKBP-type peptidyl-prolyl cis-trans isomerase [Chitinophagales bacterium]
MKYFLAVLTGIFLITFFSCTTQDDYQTSPNGLKYKIIIDNKQPKAQVGQYISYHVAWRTMKDSLLFSSEGSSEPLMSLVARPIYDGDPWEIFTMVGQGDSASCRVQAKLIFKTFLPPNIKGDDPIKLDLKVLAVYSAEQYDSVRTAAINAQYTREDQMIQNYMRENGLQGTKTPSGIYVVMEKEGTGKQAAPGNTVLVDYTGTLLNGTQFDSSRKPGGQPYPVTIGKSSVIAGWTEGLTYFKKGGKGKLLIPSRLAYGERGNGPVIGPNEPLAFDIEITDMK